MGKRLILLGMSLITVFLFGASVFASSTTSWDFEIYNKPYAESIALQIAQAQAGLGEHRDWRDPLGRFKDILARQILNRIARMLIDEAFGEDALQPGQYTIGDYIIDISTDGEVITVVITDTITGNTTTIEIPYYDYVGFSE